MKAFHKYPHTKYKSPLTWYYPCPTDLCRNTFNTTVFLSILGTSTGAMLALNLVQGKCVRYNRCLYFRLKEKIFKGNRPYSTEGLESLLRGEFGETPVMTDIPDVR